MSSTNETMAASRLTDARDETRRVSAGLPADSSSPHWLAFFLILSIFDATLAS